MFIADRLQIGEKRRTKEGYLAVRARAARAGIYDYLGREIDPEGKHFAADQVVKVYRPEEEVFSRDSVQSFMLKPITDDHPAKPVTADNWRNHAKGVNAGALRDGEYLAFDLVLMDAGLIDAVEKGKRELSNGYSSEIIIGEGVTDKGEHFDATQRQIRGNHVAVVDKGRAGELCRIQDAPSCDSIHVDLLERLLGDGQTYNENSGDDKTRHQRRETVDKGVAPVATKTILVDGLNVEVTDDAERAILKLQGQLADSDTALDAAKKSVADEQAKVVERDATITAKDARITELEGQLKDAAITPAKLADAAKIFADVCAKAKAMGVTFAEDADADAIKKAVVLAKMGDKAKDYSDDHIAIAFDALTDDAKVDPLRDTIRDGIKPKGNGATALNDARQAWLANKEGAYRGAEVEA